MCLYNNRQMLKQDMITTRKEQGGQAPSVYVRRQWGIKRSAVHMVGVLLRGTSTIQCLSYYTTVQWSIRNGVRVA